MKKEVPNPILAMFIREILKLEAPKSLSVPEIQSKLENYNIYVADFRRIGRILQGFELYSCGILSTQKNKFYYESDKELWIA